MATHGNIVKIKTSWEGRGIMMPRILTPIKWVISEYANKIQKAIQASFQEPKSGRFYTGKSGRIIQASAPGESPAIDRGKLFSSIRIKRYAGGLMADIGVLTGVPSYASLLENTKQRPFIKPIRNQFSRQFVLAMQSAINRAV